MDDELVKMVAKRIDQELQRSLSVSKAARAAIQVMKDAGWRPKDQPTYGTAQSMYYIF